MRQKCDQSPSAPQGHGLVPPPWCLCKLCACVSAWKLYSTNSLIQLPKWHKRKRINQEPSSSWLCLLLLPDRLNAINAPRTLIFLEDTGQELRLQIKALAYIKQLNAPSYSTKSISTGLNWSDPLGLKPLSVPSQWSQPPRLMKFLLVNVSINSVSIKTAKYQHMIITAKVIYTQCHLPFPTLSTSNTNKRVLGSHG